MSDKRETISDWSPYIAWLGRAARRNNWTPEQVIRQVWSEGDVARMRAEIKRWQKTAPIVVPVGGEVSR